MRQNQLHLFPDQFWQADILQCLARLKSSVQLFLFLENLVHILYKNMVESEVFLPRLHAKSTSKGFLRSQAHFSRDFLKELIE